MLGFVCDLEKIKFICSWIKFIFDLYERNDELFNEYQSYFVNFIEIQEFDFLWN
jgi:hypothetical protein